MTKPDNWGGIGQDFRGSPSNKHYICTRACKVYLINHQGFINILSLAGPVRNLFDRCVPFKDSCVCIFLSIVLAKDLICSIEDSHPGSVTYQLQHFQEYLSKSVKSWGNSKSIITQIAMVRLKTTRSSHPQPRRLRQPPTSWKYSPTNILEITPFEWFLFYMKWNPTLPAFLQYARIMTSQTTNCNCLASENLA